MITPMQIYWVMQLDSIRDGLLLQCILLAVVSFVAITAACINILDETVDASKRQKIWLTINAIFWTGLFSLSCVARTFIPSTKTACAMFAIPMVVNNETIQADSAEVYRLGMERLKEVLETEKEKP